MIQTHSIDGILREVSFSREGTTFSIKPKLFEEGNFKIYYHRGFNISGYGNTLEDAKESFLLSVDVFIDDMKGMSYERVDVLIKQGLSKLV